jgi:hypothetical protein
MAVDRRVSDSIGDGSIEEAVPDADDVLTLLGYLVSTLPLFSVQGFGQVGASSVML